MRRLVWWLQWHRRLGAVVALLVVALAITGILINHSQSLGWHRQPVYSSVLAWMYGIPKQPVESGYAVQGHWVAQVGESIFLDATDVQSCASPLRGALVYDDMLVVLCEQALLLLEPQGALIEMLTRLPAQGQALALQDGRLLLRTPQAVFEYHDDRGDWSVSTVTTSWITAQRLPDALIAQFAGRNPVPGLTREQVLLDLHSGRLFGSVGVWVVDLIGIAICLLAFSGVYAWLGRKLRHRR